MSQRDEDQFKLRPRPPRSRSGPRAQRFLTRVQVQVERVGRPGAFARPSRRPGARSGRGFAVGRTAPSVPHPHARRVTVKARVVYLRAVSTADVHAHLGYIAREGVGRSDEDLPYQATSDHADLQSFEARSAGDRHQFRFVVSPEDASELEDLRGFVRHLMEKVESDLGTRLDWVAVDHWDTDKPHTHVVVRGKEPSGRDLIIAGEYIAKGMRLRASEIATAWLGQRTELEIEAGLRREMEAERWTSLDRRLLSRCHDGQIDLSDTPEASLGAPSRTMLVGRLERLRSLGLARQDSQSHWWLRDDTEEVLRRLGERGDIIRTMQRAVGDARRDLAIFDGLETAAPIVGRVMAKGLIDELKDQSYLVVDGLDARVHYVAMPNAVSLAEFPVGGIVDVRASADRQSDRNIVAAASNGVYRTDVHASQLRASHAGTDTVNDIVDAHVRRLEALRRARIVERLEEGVWRVPSDLIERGRQYDRRRLGGANVSLLCHLPIERQVRAIGATWLDQQLIQPTPHSAATTPFGVAIQHAMRKREDFLIEQGLARHDGTRVVLRRNLLAHLRDRELSSAAKAIAAETGLVHRPLATGTSTTGTYRGSIQLASGRFAVLENALGFSLVPWRPVIEPRLGRSMTASVRGGHVVWEFGRQRGLGR